MARTARLAISADRYTPCIRTLIFRGVDLEGAALQMSIRPTPDGPGAPLADLLTVTNGNAEGLRLVGVDRTGPVPISTVALKINEATMAALPYNGEVGDVTELAYDMQVTLAYKRVVLAGPFLVVPGVVGSNAAPASRPAGAARSTAPSGDWSSATLTFSDDVTEVSLTGVDLLEPIVAGAKAAQAGAETARDQAWQAAETVSGAIRITQVNDNAAKITASKPAGTTIRQVATDLVMIAKYARSANDGGVELVIQGFNDNDPRQMLREDGNQIEDAAWAEEERLRLYFDGALFRLIEPARASAAAGAASEYQLIALSHARMGV